MDTLKRRGPVVDDLQFNPKRVKEEQDIIEQEQDDNDFALARLRCLGMDGDSKEKLLGEVVEKPVKSSRKLHLPCHEEKELRRERGELLLKLFREVPWLGDSASARRAEKNLERAQMWEIITEKVNNSFGEKLEILSIEKVKKLLTYYKKKDDGSYDNIKHTLPLAADDNEIGEDGSLSHSGGSISEERPGSADPLSVEVGGAKGVAVVEEAAEGGNKQLLDFLAFVGNADNTSSPAPSIHSPHTVASSDTMYQLKKDRHDFVVNQADHYMDRLCFDNSSRSAAVNAERHSMWIKITHKTNEKFGTSLGPLGVEQAKKLYSNCKRRRRVRAENARLGINGDSAAHSRESLSLEPDDVLDPLNDVLSGLGGGDNSTDYDTPTTNLEELIRGLDRTVEIDNLKKQLEEKDAEVDKLKKKIVEQAQDYSTRIKAMVELLKVAVDKKTSDDIRSFLT